MATVLFAWELGLGYGHLMSIRPLAERMADDGHRVFVAIKNFAGARRILANSAIVLLPAPIRQGAIRGRFTQPATFAHLLHNNGFGDPTELQSMTSAWQAMIGYVRPDLIVSDHSPTALLAARAMGTKVALLGTGFSCPAHVPAFPDWRPELKNQSEQLARDEQVVLDNANAVLGGHGGTRLTYLSDLYCDAEETILVTYPELDPFAPRADATYFGNWPELPAESPHWPAGNSARIFAYVRSFPGCTNLLRVLSECGHPTILRAQGDLGQHRNEFSSETLVWQDGFIDIDRVTRECDVAISNATHVMTASMLLAGTPVLMFPLYIENRLTAEKILRMGAGQLTNPSSPEAIARSIERLFSTASCKQAAQAFSERYAGQQREQRLDEAIARLCQLLP